MSEVGWRATSMRSQSWHSTGRQDRTGVYVRREGPLRYDSCVDTDPARARPCETCTADRSASEIEARNLNPESGHPDRRRAGIRSLWCALPEGPVSSSVLSTGHTPRSLDAPRPPPRPPPPPPPTAPSSTLALRRLLFIGPRLSASPVSTRGCPRSPEMPLSQRKVGVLFNKAVTPEETEEIVLAYCFS